MSTYFVEDSAAVREVLDALERANNERIERQMWLKIQADGEMGEVVGLFLRMGGRKVIVSEGVAGPATIEPVAKAAAEPTIAAGPVGISAPTAITAEQVARAAKRQRTDLHGVERKCLWCGETFTAWRKDMLYCKKPACKKAQHERVIGKGIASAAAVAAGEAAAVAAGAAPQLVAASEGADQEAAQERPFEGSQPEAVAAVDLPEVDLQ